MGGESKREAVKQKRQTWERLFIICGYIATIQLRDVRTEDGIRYLGLSVTWARRTVR